MAINTHAHSKNTTRSKNQASATTAPLVIRNWTRTVAKDVPVASASIDGFEVHFKGSALTNVPERADAYLAIGLLPAMYSGRPLDLTNMPPVSAGMLAGVHEVQEILSCWNPYLHRVPILAREEATPSEGGALTFFSGGVDAVHSALHLGADAGRLVTLNGFDLSMSESAFSAVRTRLAKLSARLGHELLTIETNWIDFTQHHRIARSLSHGACLAAIAHLMHPATAHIASAFSSAALFPWGSHPLLDPCWSSDSVRIVHVGNYTPYVEKIARVVQQPELLGLLCICHQKIPENCGSCVECRRTRAMLSILNADTSAIPSNQGDALDAWLKLLPEGNEMIYLNEVTDFINRTQREDIARRLMRGQRAALRRDVVRRFWNRMQPGLARKRDSESDLLPWGYGPRPEHL